MLVEPGLVGFMQAGQDGRYVAVERIAYADTAAPICHI